MSTIVTMKPTEIVSKLLSNTTNLDIVKELVAEDATYVSLNYDDPDLTAVSHTTLYSQSIYHSNKAQI